ncbi:hypothetical protein SAMN03080615_04363 [Amphritea atlantica]|uniref:Sporulation related domain-containing protein n=1 Tax=Amphritea atlantica TaxID=355243 RepID=A0A1H9MC31_9GAMM|nr:hypothetical protein [Amphritea atlantica]SER20995.1 hypothetical protein SAMN03080615_04363 [Amphritea atlantica]
MDKVYPIATLIAAMTITVTGSASERVPRLPSSTYNVEIRPDNYYYHEQQLGAWFIQCYQRKQPAERYWHCNASDSETIRRFRTTLKDPALAFTAPEPAVHADTSPPKQPAESLQRPVPTRVATLPPDPPKQTPQKKTVQAQQHYLAAEHLKKKRSANPQKQTKPVEAIRHHTPTIQTTFNNPALEPETYYLLQLAAFQNKKDANRWQQGYPDIATRIIRTQGKFTQWFNVVTAQPVEYFDAIALSEAIKDQTGETPWIREKKELL